MHFTYTLLCTWHKWNEIVLSQFHLSPAQSCATKWRDVIDLVKSEREREYNLINDKWNKIFAYKEIQSETENYLLQAFQLFVIYQEQMDFIKSWFFSDLCVTFVCFLCTWIRLVNYQNRKINPISQTINVYIYPYSVNQNLVYLHVFDYHKRRRCTNLESPFGNEIFLCLFIQINFNSRLWLLSVHQILSFVWFSLSLTHCLFCLLVSQFA